MEVRDAVEADAEAMAAIADAPIDVMRNLVHDRSVRIAVDDDEPSDDDEAILGFVSFDARPDAVHVTQLDGTPAACRELLGEPVSFARREGMPVELLVPADHDAVRDAAEAAGFVEDGTGPRFGGESTVRYRLSP